MELKEALSDAASVDFGEVDVEAALARYREAGYEVTDQLRNFLENYGELTVTWLSRVHQRVASLSTTVDSAMEVFPALVKRGYTERLGMPVLPVGLAFETEDAVLLAENGDILFGSDAGMQRVAGGFEEAVKALISGNWDRTFF